MAHGDFVAWTPSLAAVITANAPCGRRTDAASPRGGRGDQNPLAGSDDAWVVVASRGGGNETDRLRPGTAMIGGERPIMLSPPWSKRPEVAHHPIATCREASWTLYAKRSCFARSPRRRLQDARPALRRATRQQNRSRRRSQAHVAFLCAYHVGRRTEANRRWRYQGVCYDAFGRSGKPHCVQRPMIPRLVQNVKHMVLKNYKKFHAAGDGRSGGGDDASDRTFALLFGATANICRCEAA